MAMSLVDLGQFYLKRSPDCAHYALIFPCVASAFMGGRHNCLEHYDSIFITGPHQAEEIRKNEAHYSFKKKMIVEHGYERLDKIIAEEKSAPMCTEHSPYQVVFAPSWGKKSSSYNVCGDLIIEKLLAAGMKVIFRPHPMTIRQEKKALAQTLKKFGDHRLFAYESEARKTESLRRAHLLITDWSGIAHEFAFGRLRPVIFIDTPRKINNKYFPDIDFTPMEVYIREQVGVVLAPNQLTLLPQKAQQLMEEALQWREKIQAQRERWIYHLGKSVEVGAAKFEEIYQLENKTTA